MPGSGGERHGKGGGLGGGGSGRGRGRDRDRDRVTGGEVVAEESYSRDRSSSGVAGGRPYGVTSVHACDDGSRIAVSE